MGDNNDNLAEGGKSILSVIPQVFYDFIARVIPGSLIIILSFITYKGSVNNAFFTFLQHKNELPSSFIVICMSLVVAYGTAIILWRQIEWIRIISCNKLFSCKKASLSENVNSYIYDYIKSQNYSAGSRITKLRAEVHMTEVLTIGLIYNLVYNTILLVSERNISDIARFELEIFIVLFICGTLTTRNYFRKRSTRALFNHYMLFKGPDVTEISTELKKLEDKLQI